MGQQSRAKAARRNNGKEPEEDLATVTTAEQPEAGAMSYPSILVMRVPGEQPGQVRIEMMEINGLDPLSVPTVLRIAANIKEQSFGLTERKQ